MKSKKIGNARKAAKKTASGKGFPKKAAPQPSIKLPVITVASTPKPKVLRIPPILLEGDSAPPPPPVSGPGRRYELAPPSGVRESRPTQNVILASTSAPVPAPITQLRVELPIPVLAEAPKSAAPTPPPLSGPLAFSPPTPVQLALPESYGTRQLFLAARDPRWLYAYWDFSRDEIQACNAQSADGHMVLRIFRETAEGEPLIEIPLGAQSRDWFVPVPFPGTKYVAQLGYFDSRRKWVQRATSGATATPPDKPSVDRSVQLATLPPEPPAPPPVFSAPGAPQAAPTPVPLPMPVADTSLPIIQPASELLPIPSQFPTSWFPIEWTTEQEQALAEIVSPQEWRQTWISSIELAELIKRQIQEEISSQAAAQKKLESFHAGPVGGPSSPVEKSVRRRGFWFQVNAELVVYGATEPDAKVTIGGRLVKLGPDGRFSFRFALPDGDYSLPIAAESADRVEMRRADLAFARHSHYSDGVGVDAQDPKLRPPIVDALV